jgi:hypothetical protein
VSEKGISIKLAGDESDFVKSVKRGEESLEDLQKTLDDVSDDGAKSVEKLDDKFSDTIKTVKDLGDASESSLRKTKRGADDAGDGIKDLKQEANSTAKEAAASFDGSAESIIDAFQEVSAQAFAGFGPAGAIAGLAAAAGIGIAMSAFEAFQEEQKKTAERIAALGEQFIDSGHTGADAIQNIVDKLKELATTTEDGALKLSDIEKQSKKIDERFSDLAQAYAGGAQDLEKFIEKLKEERKAYDESNDATDRYTNKIKGAKLAVYDETIGKLQQVQDETLAAQEIERQAAESGMDALQAKADAISGINDAYDDTVNSITDYVDAESGILDVDAYLAAIEARRQALVDYQNNLVAANLTDEQKSALNAMGQEAAAVWLEAYVSPNTTDDQKRRLSASLTEASKEASGAAKITLDKEFGDGVTTKLKLDTSDAIAKADSDIRNWAPDEKALTLRLNIVDRYGQPIP